MTTKTPNTDPQPSSGFRKIVTGGSLTNHALFGLSLKIADSGERGNDARARSRAERAPRCSAHRMDRRTTTHH